jgi:ABC-2 type transport system ATP-binding protein
LGVEEIREPSLDGRMLRARADEGARAIPTVLALLEAEGIRVVAATVARPSLDDVYLRHTGRTFEEAER